MGLVWDRARQHFAIYKQPLGFYVAMPKGWGADYVKGPMDFAIATNETLKVNEVRRYCGEECNDKSFDELLSVYPALVERGDITPVTLIDEPEAPND